MKSKKPSLLARLKQRYRRFKVFRERLKPREYTPFLEKVNAAIVDLLRNKPEEETLLNELRTEANRWLNEMPFLHVSSFKAGVCTGIALYLQNKEREGGELRYVV